MVQQVAFLVMLIALFMVGCNGSSTDETTTDSMHLSSPTPNITEVASPTITSSTFTETVTIEEPGVSPTVHPRLDSINVATIDIEPEIEHEILCGDREATGIFLESAGIEISVIEQVGPDFPIFLVTGQVHNRGEDGPYVAIWATGYDSKGDAVSETLDQAHIVGQARIYVQHDEIKPFVLHLRLAENVEIIKISTCPYSTPPP
ncbi:MAG: hypothetical protein GY845_07285 [Planctomycetes bacterium]|nr:hypothetical protein [Planctomycetota bacterium]